ncbi:hypothetical protein [Pandoraea pulmonicola]|nr:hypothetical protein [Pandoraea pulmonicola]
MVNLQTVRANKSADYRTKSASFGATVQNFSIRVGHAQSAPAVRTDVAASWIAVWNEAPRRKALREFTMPAGGASGASAKWIDREKENRRNTGQNAWQSERDTAPAVRGGCVARRAAGQRGIRLAKNALGAAKGTASVSASVIARSMARGAAQYFVTLFVTVDPALLETFPSRAGVRRHWG